jgi:hypothetical protein
MALPAGGQCLVVPGNGYALGVEQAFVKGEKFGVVWPLPEDDARGYLSSLGKLGVDVTPHLPALPGNVALHGGECHRISGGVLEFDNRNGAATIVDEDIDPSRPTGGFSDAFLGGHRFFDVAVPLALERGME